MISEEAEEPVKKTGFHPNKMSKPDENQLKRLFLSKEEQDNLRGRKTFFGYIVDLVERDINIYLSEVVAKRLDINLSENDLKLAEDASYVELVPKLSLPKNGKN